MPELTYIEHVFIFLFWFSIIGAVMILGCLFDMGMQLWEEMHRALTSERKRLTIL
jgi:uncharacterized BrkB/YihY/UPF0761 family membrane protein